MCNSKGRSEGRCYLGLNCSQRSVTTAAILSMMVVVVVEKEEEVVLCEM